MGIGKAMKVAVVIMLAVVLAAGCTSIILTDDRIRANTAGIIGVGPDELSIENRRTEMDNIYYTAKTKSGDEYECFISGGNIMTMGDKPPSCTLKPPAKAAQVILPPEPAQPPSPPPPPPQEAVKEIQTIATPPPVPEPKAEPVTPIQPVATYLVTRKGANIRAEASTKSKIIATLKKGEKVEKRGKSGNWFNIKLSSGETGWIFKDLVKEAE